MDRFKTNQELIDSITTNLKEKGCYLSLAEVVTVIGVIREEVLYQYVEHLVDQVEAIMEINIAPYRLQR